MNCHPEGCKTVLEQEIAYVQAQGAIDGPKNVLIIGGSTGYGLASRTVAAFAAGANTLNVSYDRGPSDKRVGTPGWYYSEHLAKLAKKKGLQADNIFGDAFPHEMKEQVIEHVRKKMGKLDLIVYSLAAPRRTDPVDGKTYTSVIKPIGSSYSAKTVDFMKGEVTDTVIEPAAEEEIQATAKVMGGEDWQLWIEALYSTDLLAEGALTVAFSYIGPELTYPVYREGTIGKAKEHLEQTANMLNQRLNTIGGEARISVNKALVTRASAVIPVVPLYISILYKVMKEKNIHEGCIEQMYRLFDEKLYRDGPIPVDEKGRIRLDDLEMREDVQKEIAKRWEMVNSQTLSRYTDIEGYRQAFLRFHGFGVENVDYQAEVHPNQ